MKVSFVLIKYFIAPRLKIHLEVDDRFVTLVNCEEEELSHIVNKPMRADEIILKLRYAGICIAPLEEDIAYSGFRIKNKSTLDNFLLDIVMGSKSFAFKSHSLNNKVDSTDLVLAKIKPNPEHDDYFFDDEERDWSEICWFPNKVQLGKAESIKYKDDLLENQLIEDFKDEELKSKIDFIPSCKARRNIIGLIEENPKFSVFYPTVSESDESIGYLTNMRNFLRIVGIGAMP